MNSPARLLAILTKMLSSPVDQNVSAHQTWARIFEIDETDEYTRHDLLVATLQGVRAELDLGTAALESKGISPALYVDQFNRFRVVISPAHYNTIWAGLVGNINPPDTRLAFAWAAEVVPDDEAELPSEDRSALLSEIETLLAELNDAQLPSAMRAFISKQLQTIKAALRMYDVQGPKPISDAISNAMGAAVLARTSLKEEVASATPAARGFMERANAVITKTVNALDLAEKMKKGSTAFLEMAEGVRGIIDSFSS
jgi:hypothetical protein